ncbi:MAG: class I SAM-dependent methyltransferase [Chitinophagia bacterium]|nr:class I SAM-dependent methyltransferase [Chitinophagia bacterium]
MFRPWVRRLFAGLHALPLMDRLHFLLSAARYASANRRFRSSHPGFAMPPDSFLHETYRLEYAEFAQDGLHTARELFDRCRPFLWEGPTNILDWGCGVARVTRHLPALPGIRSVAGADVNEAMIR